MRAPAATIALAMLLISLQHAWALRGPGLPLRELFSAGQQPELPSSSSNAGAKAAADAASPKSTPPPASPPPSTNTSMEAGLTISGLTAELKEKAQALKEGEHAHSRATIAVAATLGSILLGGALAFVGAMVWRRFTDSQHARKRGAGPKLPYYDADRLLGDSGL